MATGIRFPAGSRYRCAQHLPAAVPRRPAAALDPAAKDPIPPNPFPGVAMWWNRTRCAVSASIFLTRKLEEMHPADLADIVEELGPAER